MILERALDALFLFVGKNFAITVCFLVSSQTASHC